MIRFLKKLTVTLKFKLLIVCVLLSGCTLIPKYHRPALPISTKWPGDPSNVQGLKAADIGWREFFSDPRLQKLIEAGLKNNRDLRIALLNVEQVRAQYRIFTYAFVPTVDGQAGNVRQREALSPGEYSSTSKYSVGLNTSYEIDLFGHIRSLKEEALQQYLATEQAGKSAQIALVSQIAVQYFNERALNEELVLSQETLKAVQSYYDLMKRSYDLGNTSALDLHSAEVQVQTAQVNIAAYQRQHDQAQNALMFLIGEPLSLDLPAGLSLSKENLIADLSPGIPSDLLDRRPDILAAEHELKAANANIGAARSAFFPQITLTAQGGSVSYQLAELFTPGSGVWKFAPQVTIPIFNTDTNFARMDIAHTKKLMAVAQYEKVIQNAFREVSDALIAISAMDRQVMAQKALVEAQSQRFTLADQRYRHGADSYLTVLTAQEDLYRAQQDYIQLEFLRLSNLISFYKALGGGWQEHTLQTIKK